MKDLKHMPSLGDSWFEGSLGKYFRDIISTNKNLSVMAHTCHASYMGSINRVTVVHAV
jgi:hypothetical protein